MADGEFEDNFLYLVEKRRFEDLLVRVTDPANDHLVVENTCNLICLVCATVKRESLLKDDTDVTRCQKVLLYLVDKARPKEVLLALLQEADTFKDHEFFCLLLEPLKCTLRKIPGKRGKSLQWVFSTLNAHLKHLKPPEDLDLQGEEKLLLDTDPAVHDATYVLSQYLSFVEYFVDELKDSESYYVDRVHNQRDILQRYLLKVLHQPLLYHDLHVVSESRPRSTVRVLCENCVGLLSKICRNVFNLYRYDEEEVDHFALEYAEVVDQDDPVSPLALANLSYLVFVENLAAEFRPFVYSHLYAFKASLKYIILLLKEKENLVLFKGLRLAVNLLNQLEASQLNYNCIELKAFTEFPKLLLDVAIFCKIEAHRKSAIDAFRSYVSKCNSKGQYHLIMQVLSTVPHSGAQGFVINLYKNSLHEALNGSQSGDYFLGKNLNSFLRKVFVLGEGVETDILENSDKIVTSLNFLRYLLLRDPKEKNSTGVWDLVPYISENFCTLLTTALDLSRAHYKQSLMDAEGEESTVTVNNKACPSVPVHLRKDLYRKALTTFDVIESLLCRVNELI